MLFYGLLLVAVLTLNGLNGDFLNDQIYINIKSTLPCIRRLNSTAQIGCTHLDTNGILYIIQQIPTDLDRLTQNNNYLLNKLSNKLILASSGKYFQHLIDFYLNTSTTTTTGENKYVNGLILLHDDDNGDDSPMGGAYSDDRQIPNQGFNAAINEQQIEWNANARSIQFRQFDIPIYLVFNQKDIESMAKMYDKHNRAYFEQETATNGSMLLGVQMGLEMYAAGNSRVCLRRNQIKHTLDDNTFCDPLGGSNLYSFLNVPNGNDERYLMVTSRIDTFTLFEYYTPYGNEPLTSIIAFMSIVNALFDSTSMGGSTRPVKNVLFYLFDNEAFDYGGSQRFIYDLMDNTFPGLYSNGTEYLILNASQIDLAIELGQLGNGNVQQSDTSSKLFMHKYKGDDSGRIMDFVNGLKEESNGTIDATTVSLGALPPSSLNTFYRFNSTISGVYISDHEREYTNRYYHSVFDSYKLKYPVNYTESQDPQANYATNLSISLQQYTQSITKTILKTLDQATTVPRATTAIDVQLLNRLIYCFYKNTTCSLFRSILNSLQLKDYLTLLRSSQPPGRLTFYTGVNNSTQSGRYIISFLFKYVSRQRQYDSLNSTECVAKAGQFIDLGQNENNYVFNGTLCIVSKVYQNSSRSPAFKPLNGDNDDDGLYIIDNNTLYSTWTESQWENKQIQMKLFLYNNKFYDFFTFFTGLVFTALSFLLIFVFNRFMPSPLNQQNTITSQTF